MFSNQKEVSAVSFPVVGIGGSAGSLVAYREILRCIPRFANIAVVIVSHRSREHSRHLLPLLSRPEQLEVVEATGGEALRSQCVFLAPPHRELTTDGIVLNVASSFTSSRRWPTTISIFLYSLAKTLRSRAVAVIVSGMGHDGSDALHNIKDGGGATFAQSDAFWRSMPQAAVDTGYVDFELTAAEIGQRLDTISR